MFCTLVITINFLYYENIKGDVIMDRLIRIMYDLYVGDTSNNDILKDEVYDNLISKLIDLEEKLKAMLKQGSNSKKDIDQIVDDIFFC